VHEAEESGGWRLSALDDAEPHQSRQDARRLSGTDACQASNGAQAELARGFGENSQNAARRPRDDCLHWALEVHEGRLSLKKETIVSFMVRPQSSLSRGPSLGNFLGNNWGQKLPRGAFSPTLAFAKHKVRPYIAIRPDGREAIMSPLL